MIDLVRSHDVYCKFNLIPFNPFPQSGLKASPRATIRQFATILSDAGIVTTIRKTRGDDIDAACGQLAGEISKSAAAVNNEVRAMFLGTSRTNL